MTSKTANHAHQFTAEKSGHIKKLLLPCICFYFCYCWCWWLIQGFPAALMLSATWLKFQTRAFWNVALLKRHWNESETNTSHQDNRTSLCSQQKAGTFCSTFCLEEKIRFQLNGNNLAFIKLPQQNTPLFIPDNSARLGQALSRARETLMAIAGVCWRQASIHSSRRQKTVSVSYSKL